MNEPAPTGGAAVAPETSSSTGRRPGWPELGIAALAALVFYGVGVAAIWGTADAPDGVPGVVQYAVSGLAPLAVFGVVLGLRVKDPRLLGLRRVSGRWLLIAAACGAGVIVLNILVTIVVVTLTGPPSNLQADYQASAAAGGIILVLTLLFGAVVTPLGEELLFRGVVYHALARYGPWVAVLVSSAVFAVAHGINYILPVAFVVGVVAALLVRRTGSIWPGVIVHAVNNAYAVAVPAILGVVAT